MTKYAFTGEVPMIFADLSHGPTVVVEHVHPVFAGEPIEDPEGSTVVLYPGDTITIGHEYPEHAYLEPFNKVGKKLTIADLRAELTARGVEFGASAKKAELEAILAAQPDIPTIEDGDAEIKGAAITSAFAADYLGDEGKLTNTSGDAADTSSTSSTSPEE